MLTKEIAVSWSRYWAFFTLKSIKKRWSALPEILLLATLEQNWIWIIDLKFFAVVSQNCLLCLYSISCYVSDEVSMNIMNAVSALGCPLG